jgi:hypothetical protein
MNQKESDNNNKNQSDTLKSNKGKEIKKEQKLKNDSLKSPEDVKNKLFIYIKIKFLCLLFQKLIKENFLFK